MYYDRFGRPLALSTATRTPAPHATSDVLRTYLDVHRTVWHLDSLRELAPAVLTYLESRYAASRRPDAVVVRAMDGSYPDLVLAHEGTADLREMAEVLLSREYCRALFDEQIAPSIERLSA